MAAAMYASVIAAASRAGFVLVSAELIIVPLVVLRRRLLRGRRAAALVVTVLALSAIFAWAAGWNVLWERLQNPDPFVMRREFLQSSLDMIRARPVMGFGLGTWSTAYPAYAYFDQGLFANQAHNDWAQWACEGGLPFAALMLWIAIWSVRAAVRSIWGIGVVIVFVHCFVDYPIQRPGLGAVFFLFVGLLASCQNSKKALDVL
jgi:O-antigen ligase